MSEKYLVYLGSCFILSNLLELLNSTKIFGIFFNKNLITIIKFYLKHVF